MTISPPETPRLQVVNGASLPVNIDLFADGPTAVDRAAAPLRRHLDELRRRINGLRDLVGSGAVAAPLEDTAADLGAQVGQVLDFARAAVGEVLAIRGEARHWAGTVAVMRSAARLGRVSGEPVESDAVQEVLDLWQSREDARDLAVRLEAQNARLSATALEVAGTRAYARALEQRMTSWASRGRAVTEGMVKTAVREATAAGDAAHAEATAAAVAAAAYADISGPAGQATVEIGGQVMTQAQFDAARYPLLNPAAAAATVGS